MKQRIFGCTGTSLSEFCLGTMNFGWRISDSTSFAILDAYHLEGGNFIQALAPIPEADDGPASLAASEAVVGRWWRARGLSRSSLFLATRVHAWLPQAATGQALAEQLQGTVQNSLSRLQTDYLDLLICEWPGPQRVTTAMRAALDQLVRSGQVRHVAFAGLRSWQVLDEIHGGYQGNHTRIDALQADYSLLARAQVETELSGLCEAYRLGLIARSPLAGGLLAKREGASLALGTSRLRWLAERYGFDGGAKVVRAINEVAVEHDFTPVQVALAWVLHSPHVTSALIGVNSVALLHELLGAGEVVLNASALEQLDRASSVQRLHLPLRRPAVIPPAQSCDRQPEPTRDHELLTA